MPTLLLNGMVNDFSHTCACSAKTGLNVCCEKGGTESHTHLVNLH